MSSRDLIKMADNHGNADAQSEIALRRSKRLIEKQTRMQKQKDNVECSCPVCEIPDNDMMVACDRCNVWHHFVCVGVNPETIDNEVWLCPSCLRHRTECGSLDGRSREKRTQWGSILSKRLTQSAISRYESEYRSAIEDQAKADEIARRRAVIESKQRDIEARERADEIAYLKAQAEADLKEVDREAENHQKLSQLKASFSRKINEFHFGSSASGDLSSESSFHIRDALDRFKYLKQFGRPRPPDLTFKPNVNTNVSQLDPTLNAQHHAEDKKLPAMYKIEKPFVTNEKPFNISGNIGNSAKGDGTKRIAPSMEIGLTPSNVLARQAFRFTKLPIFDGSKPSDWPLFITTYNLTTEQCGFTDVENLIRLQEALKGKARAAVEGRLFLPQQVTSVLETLTTLYGRPERILYQMVKDVEKLPMLSDREKGGLVTMAHKIDSLCGVIEALNHSSELNNSHLLYDLVQKLPPVHYADWCKHSLACGNVNLLTFSKWLTDVTKGIGMYANLESQEQKQPGTKMWAKKLSKGGMVAIHEGVRNMRVAGEQSKASASNSNVAVSCKVCSGEHHVEKCPTFLKLDLAERWSSVKKHNLCGKCLAPHFWKTCRRQKYCSEKGCGRAHHQLLHRNKESTEKSVASTTTRDTDAEWADASIAKMSAGHLHYHHSLRNVQPRVIPVRLFGNNCTLDTYAFLDEGASLTILEQHVANELGLSGPKADLCLNWTGDVTRVEKDSQCVNLRISGQNLHSKQYQLTGVRTVRTLGLSMQCLAIDTSLETNKHLAGIPIPNYQDAKPTILIGQDHYQLGLPLKICQGNWNDPVAAKTRLGWSIYGYTKDINCAHVNFHRCESDSPLETSNELHELVERSMSLESFGIGPVKVLTNQEDERAVAMLQTSTKENGRFTAPLLWKKDNTELPESKTTAIRRLQCLEKKLKKDPNMREQLIQIFDEYEAVGFIRKLTSLEAHATTDKIWYVPYFLVSNPNKPGKYRLVWDFASKSHGMSLNDALIKGPDLVPLLTNVLYNFREHPYAVVADIKQMFHQIQIKEPDQSAQRFLWRRCNELEEPSVYVMCVVTFGANCSPFTAQFIKNRNADEYSETQPRAVTAIKDFHYVDDYLDSFRTREEAIEVSRQVYDIHKKGGFELRNWGSNDEKILQAMQQEGPPNCSKNILENELPTTRVLGIRWDTKTDAFTFSINRTKIPDDVLNGTRPPTKREVLSILMAVFDPLGLISSYLVLGKIILQDVWRSKVDWDQPIRKEEHEKWLKWIETMKQLELLTIPRCYALNEDIVSRQIHIFVDSSERVFAAVAYVRTESKHGVEIRLIGSKTRVAPSRPMTIPRLELLAAVLGTRLYNSITDGHKIPFEKRYFWSDSTTVISWLYSDAAEHKQFIKLRIGEVLEASNATDWRWIGTNENVADEATKWPTSPKFTSSGRWFVGPRFLMDPEDTWPNKILSCMKQKSEHHIMTHQPIPDAAPLTPNFNAISSWQILIRSMATIRRIVRNWRVKRSGNPLNSEPLTSEDLQWAKIQLLKRAQWDCFQKEVLEFRKDPHAVLDKASELCRFSPFMSSDGLIRMRGRITEAIGVSYSTKFPVILGKKHRITFLIVKAEHQRKLHRNHESVVNGLRQEFVIPEVRRVLRTVRSVCNLCKILRSKPKPPMMAELPATRLGSFIKPFSYVGVDCFGPFEVTVGRRVEKRWGVLYTCLTIRAIHIEVVSEMSTDAFILSLIRFMERRGQVLEIVSDNGTNFRGASRELQEELKNIDRTRLQNEFSNIKWTFNPPGAPHFGGSWERMVQSVKCNLQMILKSHRPRDAVLHTALIQCEGIVNGRPLTDVPIDHADASPLTPNHFLIGTSQGAKRLSDVLQSCSVWHLRKMWKQCQEIAQQFWTKWTVDYLPTLARRTKWFSPTKPLKVGDVVLIVESNGPRNSWPKGVIDEVYIGREGQVRSAKVRTTTGSYVRPAVKLAVLDILEDNSEQEVIGVEDVIEPSTIEGNTSI